MKEELKVKVGANITGFNSKMRALQKSATRTAKHLGLAFAGTAVAATWVGAKFEEELTKTATVAQAFGKDLEALKDRARELGRTTAFTAAQVAEGMYDLASAGLNTKQIVETVDDALMLAGATGADFRQSTSLIVATMKQFGLEAEDAKRIVDTYAGGITNSMLNMDRLTEGMKYAGTTGAAFNRSLEEVVATMALFADLGLEGSMTGTQFRMAMNQLAKGADVSKDALREMGLTIDDISPDMMSFGDILEAIGRRSLSSKGAVEIFSSRAGMNIKQLAKQAAEGKINFKDFVNMLIESQKGAGRATEMYRRMMHDFKAQWTIMFSALQDVFIEVFDTYKEEGKKAFSFLADELNNVQKLIHKHRKEINEAFLLMAEGAMTAFKIIVEGVKLVVNSIAGIRAIIASALESTYEQRIESFRKKISELMKELKYIDKELKFREEHNVEAVRKGMTEKIKTLFGTEGIMYQSTEDLEKRRKILTDYIKEYNSELTDAAKNYGDWHEVLGGAIQTIETTNTLFDGLIERIQKAKEGLRGEGKGEKGGGIIEDAKGAAGGVSEDKKGRPMMGFSPKAAQEYADQYNAFLMQIQSYRRADYELEASLISEKIEKWKEAGMAQTDIERLASEERKRIAKMEQDYKQNLWSETTGNMEQAFLSASSTFKGASKELFAMYKATAIARTIINAYQSITETLATVSHPLKIPLAISTGVMAFAQVAAIKAQQPPSYDEGGISTSPGTYYAGIPEAHIPLKGGKVPVMIEGNKQKDDRPVFIMNNPTFQDLETQRAAMANIAKIMTHKEFSNAMKTDYNNDGFSRRLIRGS